ncbi:MAG: competence protein ComEC [Blastocatellia bacterium]|jgi:beta-lactamase superfamily II metal-dependent hydrolase|nr:competence protein ComEC [Blastocatellia bacterium]
MKLNRLLPLVLLSTVLLSHPVRSQTASRTLDIYFIDVEGGAATLIVTPTGESLLIDSGFPGDRDAGRIAHVALEVAGLKQIDHYVTTHWHRDHVGGIPRLAQLIPVKSYYDHGLPKTIGADLQPELIEAYKQTTQGKSVTLTPGDTIKLRSPKYMPPLFVRVLAAGGRVGREASAIPQIRPCGPVFEALPEDRTDNVNSVGIALHFGRFRFFDGGDLTWNIENRLVCPNRLVGPVDVYQVDHHGSDISNNPRLISTLDPRVAIINNGPRKGGEAGTYARLKSRKDIEGIYQLHRNVRTSDKDNTPADFVANDEEACLGNFIKLSVDPTAKSYTVTIPAKQISRTYRIR